MLTVKVDGENFLEIPLMGNIEIFIDDRLIWKTEKEQYAKEIFTAGDKLKIKFISYQDYKIAYSVVNKNIRDYNNTSLLKVGDIVTFKSYSAKSSC